MSVFQGFFCHRARLSAGIGLSALAVASASPLLAQASPASGSIAGTPITPQTTPAAPDASNNTGAPAAADATGPVGARAPAAPGVGAATKAVPGGGGLGLQSGLQEIVVTARRVNENLQKVPISVGTLTPSALQARQIFGINDLKGSVAGLTASRTTTPGSGYFTIRGTTSIALPTPAVDNTIGFYIDGVYIARSEGQGFEVPDLARVEVLRGPQGTLFGRNSAGGAINFITNVPTDRQELKYDLLYGNYDHKRASIILNEPIANGLAVRVSYQHDDSDGDVRNSTTRTAGETYAGYGSFTPVKRFGSSNADSVIAKARYTGIDGLTVDYKFDYNNLKEAPGVNQVIGFLPDAASAGLNTLLAILYSANKATVPQSFTRLSALPEGEQGYSNITSYGHLLTAEYAASDAITLKNISSYRQLKAGGFVDLDGADWTLAPIAPVPFSITADYQNLREHQFSQEDQVIGKFGDLNFILGGYYFYEHSQFTSVYSAFASIPGNPGVYDPTRAASAYFPVIGQALGISVPGPYALGEYARYRNQSVAGYLHADYRLNDVFKLSAGGRYTTDYRRANDLRDIIGVGVGKVQYSRFTYDGAINAQVTPTKLIYAKYSTGYVSGGITGELSFKPEDDRQVEVGFKTEWLDRKLRINAAAYYTWRHDIQNALPSTSQTNNEVLAASGLTPPYPLGILVYNTPGTSTVKGFEIETTLIPVTGLTLSANLGLNDPKFSDGSLYRAPKQTFAFSGEYDFPKFGNGSYLLFRVDGDYRGHYYGSGANVAGFFTGPINAALVPPGFASGQAYLDALSKAALAGGYWLANARVSIADIPIAGAKAKLSGFVQNILNTRDLLYTVNYGSSINGAFERPRTYGLELNLDF